MCVAVEPPIADEAEQSDTRAARELNREARWGRDAGKEWNSREKRLLDDLERRSAAYKKQRLPQREPACQQHPADELVDGIVPSNVFRTQFETAPFVE